MIYLVSNRQYELNPEEIKTATVSECLDTCKGMVEIQLDTETTPRIDNRHANLFMVQFGDKNTQFVLDWGELTTEEQESVITFLNDVDNYFILQNANYDFKQLYQYGVDIKNYYDTFIAECVLTTGLRDDDRDLSLTGLGEKYLNVHISKEERGTINYLGVCESTIKYAATDVVHLADIKTKQLEEIEKWELETILDIELQLVRVLSKMEYRGINFSAEKWTNVYKVATKELLDIEENLDKVIYDLGTADLPKSNRLTKYVNYYVPGNLFFEEKHRKSTINWKSSKQKLKVLKDLGINLTSTDEDTLKENQSKHHIIPSLIEYSKLSKLTTSFGETYLKFINPFTGRIHASHWQILATGRLSMSNPNIQQVPSHGKLAATIREAFIATYGYKMVCADYSGFELAIIAEFSQDPTWLGVLNAGGNLHSELCAMTFDIPIERVNDPFPYKPEYTYRYVQKTIDFG